MPPLRARRDDIPAIARHLYAKMAAKTGATGVLPQELVDQLKTRAWPGNVRELRNAIEERVRKELGLVREAEAATV